MEFINVDTYNRNMPMNIRKNKQIFKIPNNLTDSSFNFFVDRYATWEASSFVVYDIFSDKNKTFIDIGGWNGCTAIYAAKINKNVLSLEPDPIAINDFKKLASANNIQNIILIEKPLYGRAEEVNFSPKEADWNTSSSQIKAVANSNSKLMKAVTLQEVLRGVQDKSCHENVYSQLSLLKIDIEGGEQYLLDTLLEVPDSIPLYISMHYDWWEDKVAIGTWDDFFKKYAYIYATTSFGRDNNSTGFVLIPGKMAIDYIKCNPFTSLILTQSETEFAVTENKLELKNSFSDKEKLYKLEKCLLEIKNSKSFKIGNLFLRSLNKPMKWVTFPINFVLILIERGEDKNL